MNSDPFNILVAEDNIVNQEIIVEILKLIDETNVTVVENGREALHALSQSHFDLVFMDINMPIMTGDEAIRHIRQSTQPYSDIPILVLTANALSGQKEEYIACGASDYLSKPINVDDILSKTESYMREKKAPAIASSF